MISCGRVSWLASGQFCIPVLYALDQFTGHVHKPFSKFEVFDVSVFGFILGQTE